MTTVYYNNNFNYLDAKINIQKTALNQALLYQQLLTNLAIENE
ncbi:hypothetical protein BMETH_806_0 [methanotrophic bacterial endosymbiont of Bathymodiolus sp.]|nr:hypothetical protein BMETH_806_0 [methanotrophic bacterial endosymbiont of Bathymodiolus sp.]